MVLNRNPANYFAEVEQLAFAPSHMVPGIEPSPDKMLQVWLLTCFFALNELDDGDRGGRGSRCLSCACLTPFPPPPHPPFPLRVGSSPTQTRTGTASVPITSRSPSTVPSTPACATTSATGPCAWTATRPGRPTTSPIPSPAPPRTRARPSTAT